MTIVLAWAVITRTHCHCSYFGVPEHKFSESLKVAFVSSFVLFLGSFEMLARNGS